MREGEKEVASATEESIPEMCSFEASSAKERLTPLIGMQPYAARRMITFIVDMLHTIAIKNM